MAYRLTNASDWWVEIQLVRIELRVPEYGWTTQKILQHVLLDTPSLAFFTTYALLVLFWAEIYYQARAVSTDGLRPSFFTINGVVYAIQRAWDKELPKKKG
ncbi:hypothetical protein C5167_050443 [Papaver somniferum]|uniref:THH1/TOM1/TOM3 domain-containing protein n=1 Tax=Papaver somniferum TaxID=3469 RepID=A0A4Y7KRE9_PAPSO|nr:hypothetical protein C5167_050443 [Papaver somniferum]